MTPDDETTTDSTDSKSSVGVDASSLAKSPPEAQEKAEGVARNPMTHMPAWIPRLLLIIIFAIFATLAAFWFVQRVRSLIIWLVISLFLSFALEPAVNWLATKGWRRGPATAIVFLALVVVIVALIASMVPLVVNQIQELIQSVPGWLESLSKYSERWFNFELSTENLIDQLDNLDASVGSYATNIAGNILGFGAAVLGAIFQMLTIGLFTFYIVADGPRLRRAVCSLLRPERQKDVLQAWEIAIDKTGGYLYSRLLLAAVSAILTYIVLVILNVPFPVPLALWMGLVSQFIPVVGTYIAAVIPLLVAVLDDPIKALILLIYILIYQQLENYFLSPRVTAQTMDLHPAVAFGAAIAGASLMGAVGALLALPAAAIIQAGTSTYIRRHEVMESELTREQRHKIEARERREAKKRRKRARKHGAPADDSPSDDVDHTSKG